MDLLYRTANIFPELIPLLYDFCVQRVLGMTFNIKTKLKQSWDGLLWLNPERNQL